jgi:tetratricopeptide (TPR) repeat protein
LAQRFTRSEASRILGLDPSRLRYWERLRLVRPQARWGERFYGFGDLIALQTIQRLIAGRVPAKRVRRAVTSLEEEFGATQLALEQLTLVGYGRRVAVVPPGGSAPIDPLSRQWFLPFEREVRSGELRPMASRTAEDLFQAALDCESNPELLAEAVDNYRRVIQLVPGWLEAHINLGVVLYQLGRVEEAQSAFRAAVRLDPQSGIARYNLGCVLEEQGDIGQALEHLQLAEELMPTHADVHFNLALAYEKHGERLHAREQWILYLRYAPSGPWAEQARARLRQYSNQKRNAPIPFPKKA